LDFLGRTGRDDSPEVEDVDVVARRHDKAHVVLDEEHAESVAGKLVKHRAERVCFRVVEP